MISKKQFKKTWNYLKSHNNYLITTHVNPDGDGLCSSIVMAIILKKLKKKYYILMEDTFPLNFKFLIEEYAGYLFPELVHVPSDKDLKELLPETFEPESVIILDTSGQDRLGRFANHFASIRIKLNIDHHSGKRKYPGRNDLIDRNASATGELIYKLLSGNRIRIDREIAKLIYISLMTDTRNFTQSNTTSETHLILSNLLKKGLNLEKLHQFFNEHPAAVLKIYGKVISRMKLEFNGQLVYSYITQKELNKCPNKDINGLIEYLRNTENTRCAILFKAIEPNRIKISLRGKHKFDVYRIAGSFNGGGHKQAAGFSYNGSMLKTIPALLKKIKIFFK